MDELFVLFEHFGIKAVHFRQLHVNYLLSRQILSIVGARPICVLRATHPFNMLTRLLDALLLFDRLVFALDAGEKLMERVGELLHTLIL